MSETEKSPRTIRLQSAMVLLGMFVAGLVVGVSLSRWSMTPPRPHDGHRGPPGILGQFAQLGLSPEQEQRVQAIMERHRSEFEAILQESFPKMRAVREIVDKEILEVLTPEQRKKFDTLEAQRPRPPDHGPGDPFPPPGPRPDDSMFPGPPPPPHEPR
jgi:Spy/CpxP family protein refolding chaperone